MATTVDSLFSKEDLGRIEEAVRQAETQTSGEIVPFAVYCSDAYERALWRSGLAFGTIALIAFLAAHSFTKMWLPLELVEVAAGTLVATLIGTLLANYVETVKRFFAGDNLMQLRVGQRAAQAFLSEEVFNTKDRTGILIFLSLLEHKVVVLGDSGVNAKVQQADWDGVVSAIVAGMRKGTPADGLIEAIRLCGILLHREGVSITPTDKNELSDRMRMSDR